MSTFKKFPKIRRIGHEENNGILERGNLIVQEKMDGANFRFTYDPEGDRLVFGSRNVEYWNEKDIDKNFEHVINHVLDEIAMGAIRDAHQEWGQLTYFGEAMHPHTLEYQWDGVPSFLGFDIYSHELDEFLDWGTEAAPIFSFIELETVPVVYQGRAEDYDELVVPESEYRNGPGEGVVVVNETTEQRAKYRTDEFKEKHNTQSVTNPDEYDPDDAGILARQFTTEARVLKMIHKYEDHGRTIEMGIMEDLWRDIFDDIIEEEFETIFLGNYQLNTKDFRSEVASITADVLQMYLERPDDSVLNKTSA